MNINHDAANSFFFSSLLNRGVDAVYPMHSSNRSSSSDSTDSSDSSTDSNSNDSSTSTDGSIPSMDDHDDDSDDDSSISSMESNARSEDTMDRFMASFFISADPPQDVDYLQDWRNTAQSAVLWM